MYVLLLSLLAAYAEEPPARAITPQECLVIRPVGQGGRAPFPTDAVAAQLVVGTWTAPHAGDKVTLPGGATRTWETAKAGADGSFQHPALRGGYAYVPVVADSPRVMILEAAGHGMVYVNGEPR